MPVGTHGRSMFLRTMTTSVLMIALPALVTAQTWTSADGFLSITPPDASTFQAMPTPPPPFIGLWVSNDESMKFGVMKTQVPRNIELVQSSAEQGLAEEIGGKVTRLPTREVSGYEVWNMKAQGPSIVITQALVRRDGALYKVLAATVGGAADDLLVNRFINSLSIVEQTDTRPSYQSAAERSERALRDRRAERAERAQRAQQLGGGIDLHSLSKTIGGAGALIAIGLVIYMVMRGKESRQS
jgi:hypothetical protein